MQHQRTPHHEFWLPILSALIHQGGSAYVQDVYRFVEGRMTFNTYDLSYIEGSVPEPYWKNQIRVAVLRMREEGLIEPSRQRNLWEISQKGREFWEEKRSYVPMESPNDTLQSQEELAEPSDFDQVILDHLAIDMSALTGREGRLKLVEHFRRERNREIIKAKKQQVLHATGCLICEVCGFDFARVYGHIGRGFCEVHHKVPLAEVDTEVTTKLKDLAILCANCHRMVHRTNPFKSLEELKQLVASCT